MADALPATALELRIDNTSNDTFAVIAISVAVDGTVTMPVLVTTTQSPGDNSTKAATTAYVDAAAAATLTNFPRLILARLATTAALPANTYANGTAGVGATITITATGVLTVDSNGVALDDIIEVKDEASASHNGCYLCTTEGAVGVHAVLTRVAGMDSVGEFSGALVSVGPDGTVNKNTLWQCIAAAPITVGTTSIAFQKQSGSAITYTDTEIVFRDGVKGGNPLSIFLKAAENSDLAPASYAYPDGGATWRLWVYPTPLTGTFTLDIRKRSFGNTDLSSGDSICAGAQPSITGNGTDFTTSGSLGTWTGSPINKHDMITVVPLVNSAGVQWYRLSCEARRALI
jgi:hypothetical protein